jgi:hypothetical protein
MDTQMDDEVPILDEENYSTWRIQMKVHLKEYERVFGNQLLVD